MATKRQIKEKQAAWRFTMEQIGRELPRFLPGARKVAAPITQGRQAIGTERHRSPSESRRAPIRKSPRVSHTGALNGDNEGEGLGASPSEANNAALRNSFPRREARGRAWVGLVYLRSRRRLTRPAIADANRTITTAATVVQSIWKTNESAICVSRPSVLRLGVYRETDARNVSGRRGGQWSFT